MPLSDSGNVGGLARTIAAARRRLLQMHFESRAGHIGGNLSSLDLMMVLHHGIMDQDDVFILSKGHAAGALYVTLWSLGKLTDDDLQRFHGDGSKLAGHPIPNWLPEIPFATGSLGHGLPLAAGIALGKSIRRQKGRVFCLISDGELQEGATWEALIFLKQRRIAPLTILVDANGLQGFGTTEEVAGLELSASKFHEFGFDAQEIDGHEIEAIQAACTRRHPAVRVVIAHTRKGHGVSFMENRMEWHYLPMSAEQYRMALQDLDAGTTRSPSPASPSPEYEPTVLPLHANQEDSPAGGAKRLRRGARQGFRAQKKDAKAS